MGVATGNAQSPFSRAFRAVQPWTEGALIGLASDVPVLIVDLKPHEMVDMVLSLDRCGHRGKITALSSRGLLSLPHRPVKPFPVAAEYSVPGLSELSAWLRHLAQTMTEARVVIGARRSTLRPHP